ncbi:MAG TPA: hypothetical protein DEB06_04310, partial [Phycisphaerales bacterium]|nr:hypothetical protein [Phycisphaerales bacterium]
ALLLLLAGSGAALGADDATDALGRRATNGTTTTLAFKNVTVEQVVPFIVETTGKVVLPQAEVLTRRVTILNDRPIPQAQALDLVFLALQQAGIAVVETRDLITLRDISEVDRQSVPVLGAEESTLERTDLGTMVEKVFALRHASAKNLGDILKDAVPDYGKLFVDEQSNQVVVRGNISLLQRVERIVVSLDRPSTASLTTATFRLRFADATQIAQNIRDLYEQQSSARNQGAGTSPADRIQRFFGPQGAQQEGGRGNQRGGTTGRGTDEATPVGASQNLRVTANTQQNSVTVLAEEPVIAQIRRQVEEVWDRPLPEEAVVPKIYDLKNTDPIKVRDLLEGLFGTPSSSAGTGTTASASQGVGRLAGQFSFQAVPEAGRLVVISKSPDNLFVIDQIIEGLDQPQTAGLPEIVELKHASSEELAEQLNTLLAQEGTLAQIRRAESGLSADSSNASPFASDGDGDQAAQDDAEASPELINFWWQRARPPADSRGASNLVSRIRIVPVWRQNAVMVLSPPEYRQSVVDLIRRLDQPGRQVLISAVVAEISLEDATALGLRWSSQTLTPTNPDNAVSLGFESLNTQNNWLSGLFDTSVLNVNADLNVLLQALSEKTAINILSEPRIFTADNQEAEFFDGQDVPFVTDSQVNNNGNLVQSFDYRAVGIQLRVRPRITVNRDVDLRVNLELSSIQPEQTLFGGFIVDRRETTTQLIVRNGQTVVISGILRSEDSDIKRKVPLLGDIPLIGLLFTSTDTVVRSTELVAFITPIVVDNPDEVRDLNQPFRQRLDELRKELGASPTLDPGVDEPAAASSPEPPAKAETP